MRLQLVVGCIIVPVFRRDLGCSDCIAVIVMILTARLAVPRGMGE